MADKPLSRLWYVLYRETKDAGVVKKDPIGYFSCRANVGRFLGIDKAQFTGLIMLPRKTYNRVLTLADGTKLATSEENTDGKVEGSMYPLRKVVGDKSVILKTGKRIYPNDAKKTQTHTLTFAFPTWATIETIGDALGELIPTGKISKDSTPSDTEIFPYFALASGGGSYPIISEPNADANKDASTNASEIKAKAKAKGGKVVE